MIVRWSLRPCCGLGMNCVPKLLLLCENKLKGCMRVLAPLPTPAITNRKNRKTSNHWEEWRVWVGVRTSSELLRKAGSQAQTCRSVICISTRYPMDFPTHSSLYGTPIFPMWLCSNYVSLVKICSLCGFQRGLQRISTLEMVTIVKQDIFWKSMRSCWALDRGWSFQERTTYTYNVNEWEK